MAGDVRADAIAIQTAAIASVRPESLVARRLAVAAGELVLDGRSLTPAIRIDAGRIAVVGGGKAAAGMAAALESLVAPAGGDAGRLTGLVSVPEGCGMALAHVAVRETRPRAANLPTPGVVAATDEMLALVRGLAADDLAIAVVTGGGSALLAAPAAGVSLDEKIAVTRALSTAGADIRELNVVRQAASVVKAGGLARACGAGRLLVLVLSDVIGDPLESIASGPCMPLAADPAAALAVIERYGVAAVAPRLVAALDRAAREGRPPAAATAAAGSWTTPGGCRVDHVILGSNATAVDAAAAQARALGYAVTVRHGVAAAAGESADAVGRRLAAEAAETISAVAGDGRPRAVVEGGEAIVTVPRAHGLGGRNQQTVLAALDAWAAGGRVWPEGLVLESIGTDGEDGPTDAAGGLLTTEVAAALLARGPALAHAVVRCDAHPLLAAAGGLVVTGPTGTNVADVRLVLARPCRG
jgi:hydroxypyruvate reductase